jgi:leader peptidase (prepilin peptidase)/N-methyltransferase
VTFRPPSVWSSDIAPLVLAYAGLLGLAIGSFGNVVVYRLPVGRSLLAPASSCPHCDAPIRHRHNIPVLGWLALRGRCADCAAPISSRYPIVELTTGVLFVALTVRLGQLDLVPALPAYLYLGAAGVVLSLIDLDSHRLPNSIVLPSYAILAVLLTGGAAWQHDWMRLERALIGGAALFCFYLAVTLAYPAGMGFGDVKLSGLLGGMLAYLSWGTLLVGAFAGFVLGSVVGIAVIVIWGGTRKTLLPFGPFMISGALVGIFVGDLLARSYLRLTTGA